MPANAVQHISGHLDDGQQRALLGEIMAVIARAPLYVPRMPRTGRAMSVRMTNCGSLGWLTDKAGGYRYEPRHPETGEPWPAIPATLLDLWRNMTDYPSPPEACLVNWYEPGARMGLHRDDDEEDFDAPVVSLSLGDDAWFRVGGHTRRDPTERLLVRSGDVILLAGAARRIYHGIDRIIAGSGTLLDEPGRYNLTLRRVTRPA